MRRMHQEKDEHEGVLHSANAAAVLHRERKRGQVAQRVALDGPSRARRYAAGVFPRTGQDARGGARGAAVREAALHAAEERRVYLNIAALLSSFT